MHYPTKFNSRYIPLFSFVYPNKAKNQQYYKEPRFPYYSFVFRHLPKAVKKSAVNVYSP